MNIYKLYCFKLYKISLNTQIIKYYSAYWHFPSLRYLREGKRPYLEMDKLLKSHFVLNVKLIWNRVVNRLLQEIILYLLYKTNYIIYLKDT